MRYVCAVVILAIIVSRLLMSGKAEEDIMKAEIEEANRVLEESIGDPKVEDPELQDENLLLTEPQ